MYMYFIIILGSLLYCSFVLKIYNTFIYQVKLIGLYVCASGRIDICILINGIKITNCDEGKCKLY